MINDDHLQKILSKLSHVKKTSSGYQAHCPAHNDKQSSLSLTLADDGKVLINCFAGCGPGAIVHAVGLEMKDLFPPVEGRGKVYSPPKKPATVQPQKQPREIKGKTQGCIEGDGCRVADNPPDGQGCSLAQYAEAKGLPVSLLREAGLSDITYRGSPALRIPYYSATGEETAVQFRIALDGPNKFRWRTGSKPCLYGLNRAYKSNSEVILCEGPSDCHTLWSGGFPALGLPSATSWNEKEWSSLLDGINFIYIVIEPDQGGDAVRKWLSASSIREHVKLLNFSDGCKDPSALFLSDPPNFETNFKSIMASAIPWTEISNQQMAVEKAEAWALCKELASSDNILQKFCETLTKIGLVGETKNAQLLYLMLTSRHQKRPVSGITKGPSGAGKSFLVEEVARFFPPSAYYGLTSMSEHALAYIDEPLKERFLILYEAAGIPSDLANYLLRSILSEGHIRYLTVEKTSEGMKPREIEIEGPTGTLITTTAIQLHPENETRLLSLTVSDTPEQTAAILLAISEGEDEAVDLRQWQALQRWIDFSEHRVVIPYAKDLAKLIPPIAVRLRRDFTQILNLIKSHVILHQATRENDSGSRLIATIEDYAVVRNLVASVVSDGVEATVSQTIRDTVSAVQEIIDEGQPCATVQRLADRLKIDKSAALRRSLAARKKGYLINNEKQRGKPAQLVMGDPLPEDREILPDPSTLRGCTVDAAMEGVKNNTLSSGYEVLPDGQLTY